MQVIQIPAEVIRAVDVISRYIKESGDTKAELGDLNISLRVSESWSIDNCVETITACKSELGKFEYASNIAGLMYKDPNQNFEPAYSTDGQFTGGLRVECYSSENTLIFFNIDDDNYIYSAVQFNRDKWLEWKEKNSFILQLCS